jgi:hypothetical protein
MSSIDGNGLLLSSTAETDHKQRKRRYQDYDSEDLRLAASLMGVSAEKWDISSWGPQPLTKLSARDAAQAVSTTEGKMMDHTTVWRMHKKISLGLPIVPPGHPFKLTFYEDYRLVQFVLSAQEWGVPPSPLLLRMKGRELVISRGNGDTWGNSGDPYALPSKSWLNTWMKTHPTIVTRIPTRLNPKGFGITRELLDDMYNKWLYQRTVYPDASTKERIWNIDEMSLNNLGLGTRKV